MQKFGGKVCVEYVWLGGGESQYFSGFDMRSKTKTVDTVPHTSLIEGGGGRHAGGEHGQSAATMLQRHPRAHIQNSPRLGIAASCVVATHGPVLPCAPSVVLQCSTVLFLTGPALWCANGHFSFFSSVDFPASFAPPSAKIAFASGFAAKFAFAAAGFAGLRLAGFAGFAAGFATLAAKLTT